jgi:ABC-type bacteriocin/lantibiotic exporter with double-glycine peptidase domain
MLAVLPPETVAPTTTLVESLPPTHPLFIPDVPFYSQFKDITSAYWQKRTCGIAGLAMLIDYYGGGVDADTLLAQGIAAKGYTGDKVGWTYAGLIAVARKHGFAGTSYDYGKEKTSAAFTKLQRDLEDGPVMASVHYRFDPKSAIPHLVVITGTDGAQMYYNDPADKTGNQSISVSDFLKAWKKRYIVLRPTALPTVAVR